MFEVECAWSKVLAAIELTAQSQLSIIIFLRNKLIVDDRPGLSEVMARLFSSYEELASPRLSESTWL